MLWRSVSNLSFIHFEEEVNEKDGKEKNWPNWPNDHLHWNESSVPWQSSSFMILLSLEGVGWRYQMCCTVLLQWNWSNWGIIILIVLRNWCLFRRFVSSCCSITLDLVASFSSGASTTSTLICPSDCKHLNTQFQGVKLYCYMISNGLWPIPHERIQEDSKRSG